VNFVYEEQKTAQAAAVLLEANGGRMNYMKLLKLLYLADRQSLIDTGYTITGDKLVSMDRGPVLSKTYELISWGDSNGAWNQHVSAPERYEVRDLKTPDRSALSDYEEELLLAVYARFGDFTQWDLVEYTHELPEWTDPKGSSRPIDARVILREAGKSDDEIEAVASLVEELRILKTAGVRKR
jgi:uncharacterized phage-associated protein